MGYAPQRMVFAINKDEQNLPAAVAEKKFKSTSKEGVTAYVCSGTQCDKPIETLTELQLILADSSIQTG